ncbi:hypothetical protein SH1V18_38780 [Vallitalea longa]|uniref:DUF3991 domain-containing protein n=2 Tax=Vallitalea longa TaxID=2936439 RepID=A0A9W6DHF3_9FIRM|nr:hypothetical protein SH1V18_38780 [Vallitalea longa]
MMLKQKRRFTDEQIASANSVNILDYARNSGYELKKMSRNSFKIPKYGGLYIHSNGEKWYWFTRDKGGGVIQFVMEMEQKTWVEAVKQLLGLLNEIVKCEPDNKVVEEEKGELILPEKNSTYNHMIAYLIKTRKIDKDIVYDFIKQKKIYENKYRSCVFIGYDKEGIPRYASYRSTNTQGKTYRGDVENSDKSFPFGIIGKSDTVNVFESPIDLMSYLSMIKLYNINNFKNHCISLGGVADIALERYLKEHQTISNIVICLDNDKAGDLGSKRINEKFNDQYVINRHVPKGKDFNEDLTKLVDIVDLRLKNNNEIEEEICL